MLVKCAPLNQLLNSEGTACPYTSDAVSMAGEREVVPELQLEILLQAATHEAPSFDHDALLNGRRDANDAPARPMKKLEAGLGKGRKASWW